MPKASAIRAVPIDDAVIAAQQRVADFFASAHVIPQAQTAASSLDRSFNERVFAA